MKRPISIAIVDNRDSFTYNLFHYLQPFAEKAVVLRSDKINVDNLASFDAVVLSPGPGLPDDFPVLKQIILEIGKTKPVLGICLGHQAIAETFGGKLFNMHEVWHGIARDTHVVVNELIFAGIPEIFPSGRYHSWAVSDKNLPQCLTVTARDNNGTIMSIKHNLFPVSGIQFHPESVLTPDGKKILKNWINTI